MLSSSRERHSEQLRNTVKWQLLKFKIDGSRLTRDNFADVLIDEVINIQ